MNIKEKIDRYIASRRYRQVNSVLLCRDDEILAECHYNGFRENSRNVVLSVAKSIMSVCAGIALDRGYCKASRIRFISISRCFANAAIRFTE